MKYTRSFLLLLMVLVGVFTACTRKATQPETTESDDYKKAEAFFETQTDSAFYYFNKVATSSKQPLEIAMAYNQMAVIQSDAGDYFGSQESLTSSLKYLDAKNIDDHFCLASDYNELGLTSTILKHYDAAADYFDQALKYTTDTGFRLSILNNKGLSYQKKGAYKQALEIYEAAFIKVTRKKTYARILTNIAKTKWLANPKYDAGSELRKALSIRLNENDLWGQNSSYSHLADYYMLVKPDSALLYAKSMLGTALALKSPDEEIEALDKLIQLSKSPVDSKRYFSRFANLTDSLANARNAAKNQFALIRYEVEKHKADNLKLQRDNTQKRYQVSALVLIIIVVVFTTIMWYRKLRLQAQYKLRQNELKFSRKVHDVVANGLYRVMSEVEHSEKLDKEYLLDQLEMMYDQSRDISYENSDTTESAFKEKINELLMSFAAQDTRVSIVGNQEELWSRIKPGVKYEIKYVLQELMVNMSKHSGARNVVVKFEEAENQVDIQYSDDGVGIQGVPNFKNGLTSTGNRIKNIGGEITFDANSDKGLSLLISFPIT